MAATPTRGARMAVFLPAGYYLTYTLRPDGIPPTHTGPCVIVRICQRVP